MKSEALVPFPNVPRGTAQESDFPIKFTKKPWAHQLEGIGRAAASRSFAFLWEVGTGKTLAAISAARLAVMGSSNYRILVVTPLITLENWRRELREHAPELVPATVLAGKGPKRLKTLKALLADRTKSFVALLNPETLNMPVVFAYLLKVAPDVLIADELHRYKDGTAKRTKAMIQLAPTAGKVLGLTGTPITRSPLDIFAQWLVMDGGATFGTSFIRFRSRYFWDKNAGMPKQQYFPDWRPIDGAFEQIAEQLKARSMVVKKADCLDLPPLVRKKVFFELSDEQRRVYDDMRRDFVAVAGEAVASAPMVLTKALRLQQIASGFVPVESLAETHERSTHVFKGNPRADALRRLLSDLTPDHKVLVWAVFIQNYETIREVCRELGVQWVEIHGGISPAAKFDAIDRLENDPAVRVLLGHPRSGGIGVNLVAASYSIFYSRGFSLEDDIQAEARNYRGGSERHESITRIDLIAADTLDEKVAASLELKMEVSEKVLRAIAEEI